MLTVFTELLLTGKINPIPAKFLKWILPSFNLDKPFKIIGIVFD